MSAPEPKDGPPAGALDDEAEVREALRRNDRYLHEFIEALAICPYARSCRESGRLHREVLLLSEPDVEAVAAHIRRLDAEARPEIDVGLLLLPRLRIEAQPFERFVSNVQRAYQANRSQPIQFFVVAFHPELPMNLKNRDVAVRFMRRSPDPTIQLVRPEAIERVRGDRDSESVSRAIAEAGLRTVREHDPEALAALLAGMRGPARAS